MNRAERRKIERRLTPDELISLRKFHELASDLSSDPERLAELFRAERLRLARELLREAAQ